MKWKLGGMLVAALVIAVAPAAARAGDAAASTTVQVPLSVHIERADDGTAQAGVLPLLVDVRAPAERQGSIGTLQLQLKAVGVVRLLGDGRRKLDWGTKLYQQSYRVDVAITGDGAGAVRVTAVELGPDGRPRWGPADELFVLRAPDEVLTGHSSGQALQLTLLKHELAAKKITQAGYDKAVHALSEGRSEVRSGAAEQP